MSRNEDRVRKELEATIFLSPSNTVSKEAVIRLITALMDRIDVLEANTPIKYRPLDPYGGERGLTPDDR